MTDDDGIVRLPQLNNRLGSCPECGKPIWESDMIPQNKPIPRYKCMECKALLAKDDIIPF